MAILFYQTPLGGTSAYGDLKKCICVNNTKSLVPEGITAYDAYLDTHLTEGTVILEISSSYPANRYQTFNRVRYGVYSVSANCRDTITNATPTYLVEGEEIRCGSTYRITNPFNYALTTASTSMYYTFTPNTTTGGVAFLSGSLGHTSQVPANSYITKVGATHNLTIPSPVISGQNLFNFMYLYNSSNTAKLITSASTYFSSNMAMKCIFKGLPFEKPVLKKPYIVLSTNDSTTIDGGDAIEIYMDIYNPNNGMTSFTGGTVSTTNVTGRISVSSGTIRYSNNSSGLTAEVTGVTIPRTVDFTNISKVRYTFTYLAPTVSTQDILIPTVPNWNYDTFTLGNTYSGTGSTLTITVNGTSSAKLRVELFPDCSMEYLMVYVGEYSNEAEEAGIQTLYIDTYYNGRYEYDISSQYAYNGVVSPTPVPLEIFTGTSNDWVTDMWYEDSNGVETHFSDLSTASEPITISQYLWVGEMDHSGTWCEYLAGADQLVDNRRKLGLIWIYARGGYVRFMDRDSFSNIGSSLAYLDVTISGVTGNNGTRRYVRNTYTAGPIELTLSSGTEISNDWFKTGYSGQIYEMKYVLDSGEEFYLASYGYAHTFGGMAMSNSPSYNYDLMQSSDYSRSPKSKMWYYYVKRSGGNNEYICR